MFSHRLDETPNLKVALHWLLLVFNGGWVNAGGFIATGSFVSHVTGFATQFGVQMAKERFQAALGFLSVPLFFLLGAFVAGLLIDRPIARGKKPHFDWVMGLCSLFLLATVFYGAFIRYDFGASISLKKSYVMMVFLCLASGLQNAAITSTSSRSVRTTHLTGLTTDLGLGLARILAYDLGNEGLRSELRVNYLRAGSIVSFIAGTTAGSVVFLSLGYFGFMVSALIATYTAWLGRRMKLNLGISPRA